MPVSSSVMRLTAQGDSVKSLQDALARAGLIVPAAETAQAIFGTGTRDAVSQLQTQLRLSATGEVDDVTRAMLEGLAAAKAQAHALITGRIAMDYGLPAKAQAVRLYHIGFGGTAKLLVEGKTDTHGVYSLGYKPPTDSPNLEIRAVASGGKEITLSRVKPDAARLETLNLVAPSRLAPLASEYHRLAADLSRQVEDAASLGKAQENDERRDITLVSRATRWDARLIALAATAAKQSAATKLPAETLYALYRVGMPTDPQQLALASAETVGRALTKATKAGIVSMSAKQIKAAMTGFQEVAGRARLAMTAPGALSSYGDLLKPALPDAAQQSAFADLFFAHGGNDDFWTRAAQLKLPAAALGGLQLQGKLLYLTFNNAPLAQRLQQQFGSDEKLAGMADAGFHESDAWKALLKKMAGAQGDAALDKLIPPAYPGKATADRLDAYAGDLARKVRFSFPTQVVAYMAEKKQLAIDPAHAAPVANFLKAASAKGFALGRTPLNAYLKSAPHGVPALDDGAAETLRSLHRVYQMTPSTESMMGTLKAGLTSAHKITAHSKSAFLDKYTDFYPSVGEASLVYQKAQQVTAVTFNFCVLAKQLDNSPLVYGLSPAAGDKQNAKDAIVKQFPTMETLFGNMDFCQCEDCRSVLSPAAYFVDLLEFLRQSKVNGAGYTPLDTLIGKDATVPGRRPDLGALPLTCENTNTALPYIDLVNEILEYYIANNKLDSGAAYDTGDAGTDDLNAEPQHIIPAVYTNVLGKAVYPVGLPFDLWIETMRGFLNYFGTPLSKVLDVLRPDHDLELFSDAHARPYYRAQIFAEALRLSPAEYAVLTGTDPATHNSLAAQWFRLFGYADEATALHGKIDPTDAASYLIAPLASAKALADCLGLSYQNVVDVVATGFVNPGLDALIFQFDRFGLSLPDAFAYTGQPGHPALSAEDQARFEALLDGISQRYQGIHPGFDARAWLKALLPASYAAGVIVLDDPDTGCDFTHTTLERGDGSAATPLDFLRFNLFVRLWRKLGWSIGEVDRALQLFFPAALPAWGSVGFAAAFTAAWKSALVNLAHLDALNTLLKPEGGRNALLPLWSNIAVHGSAPLYAQLFLNPGVLNNDPAFDDPAGAFPGTQGDFLSAHLQALSGAVGLSADEISAVLADAGAAVATVTKLVNGKIVTAPAFVLGNLSICYRYSVLAAGLGIAVADLIALKALSGLDPMKAPGALAQLSDDTLFTGTLEFLRQVELVEDSGFDVAALQYLLRHVYDPAGPYAPDPNALTTLAQSLAIGLRQIATQNALPANLAAVADDVLQQKLAALVPAPVLQALTTILAGGSRASAAQGAPPANALDPVPFADEPALGFAYDATTQTQTVTFSGVLLDWKKTQLKQIDASPLFAALIDAVQAQGTARFAAAIGDVMGVWASLAQYEAVRTGVAALNAAPLLAADPGLRLSYDQADQLQWLAYRGVLTDDAKAALIAVDASPSLAQLLGDIQKQALPAWRALLGKLLASLGQAQSYVATATGIADSEKADPALFAAYPQVRFAYDPVAQIQTVTYAGVLTGAGLAALAALAGGGVVPGLLQGVRNQALQFLQAQAAHLLTLSPADIDGFVQDVLGANAAGRLRLAKAALLAAFQPLMARKLSRQLAVQTVAGALSADAGFTEDLLTNAALLNDPNAPGLSLLGSYLALGGQGASAAYYASADASGAALANGTAASVDLADPSNPHAGQAGTGSAHFEGYIQVPTDGPYRFFARLGDVNARAVFRLESPSPTAVMPNPVLDAKAAKANDEVSQFVVLKGGTPYRFTADFTALGAGGAALSLQGENLARGPLSQVVLIPGTAMAGFTRAQTLVAKTLLLLQTFGLDERELVYLCTHGAKFGNLRLSALPTAAADDTPAKAAALFKQFLALADYAALRKGPFGGGDGLISVFENVGVTYVEAIGTGASNTDATTPWTRFAALVRRDPQVVRDIAQALGLLTQTTVGGDYQITAKADFAGNRGVRRIWEALQIVQLVGIPVSSLIAATSIVATAPPPGSPAPDVLAAMLRSAVKARYPVESWRPVAKSVFNALRRKKRDALVAWLVNMLGLQNSDQLFEYFLVDPGMEPVVQTSRIRLALSSVQTFIQRCLLNLENGVPGHPQRDVVPLAIDAEWWSWMKRYRVWEANREIFLYPENWMEPELRLDKSDLFQALEGALSQGDITRDLVEDAFYDYLKGLEVRARLDVVATYLEQDADQPGNSVLHVLGRTYGKPHKYFYRSYASQSWSAWVAVTAEIEGDHIVLAKWRGKLNLFWLTFATKQAPAPAPSNADSTGIAGLSFSDLAQHIYSTTPQEQLLVQLNWCDYYQGQWSERLATDISKADPISVDAGFDLRDIHVHVTTEPDDAAILIHLDFPDKYEGNFVLGLIVAVLFGMDPDEVPRANHAFRVTSKNGDPAFHGALWQPPPPNPYNAKGVDATVYTGSGLLQSSFESDITSSGSKTETEKILQTVTDYALATTGNPVAPLFLDAAEPDYWQAGALVAPFFYKDRPRKASNSELTFFVQPSLTETTIQTWNSWAVHVQTQPDIPSWIDPGNLVAQVPLSPIPVDPGYPEFSTFPSLEQNDWLTNPITLVGYGDSWIGQGGGVAIAAPAANAQPGMQQTAGAFGLARDILRAGNTAQGFVMVGSSGLNTGHVGAIQSARASGMNFTSVRAAMPQLDMAGGLRS